MSISRQKKCIRRCNRVEAFSKCHLVWSETQSASNWRCCSAALSRKRPSPCGTSRYVFLYEQRYISSGFCLSATKPLPIVSRRVSQCSCCTAEQHVMKRVQVIPKRKHKETGNHS